MSLKLIFVVVLLELLIVSWIDFKTKKISNLWPLLNIILSVVFHLTLEGLYPLTWELALFPVGFITIGFFLYLLNVMGGGDSKYLASLFLIIPLEYHLMVFSKLITATIAVGSILIIMTLFKSGRKIKAYLISQYWAGIKEAFSSRFSYAPVILLAWLLFGVEVWN